MQVKQVTVADTTNNSNHTLFLVLSHHPC